MPRPENKVALISGAARGQGRSHAVRLAEQGADLILLDICQDIDTMDYPNATARELDETAALVTQQGRRAVTFQTDVRDAAATAQAVDEGVAALGRLDIVLPQAGIVRYAPGQGAEENSRIWADIIGTNLSGVYHVLTAAVPHLISGGCGGAIVLTGSTAATRPVGSTSAAQLAYISSKHGLLGMMKAYALALGDHQIRVNIVHPTGVESGMTINPAMEKLAAEAAAGGHNWISESTNLLDVQLLKAGDITDAVSFLVSDEARFITGASLVVDAGFSLK